jgi:hypothetical protein
VCVTELDSDIIQPHYFEIHFSYHSLQIQNSNQNPVITYSVITNTF